MKILITSDWYYPTVNGVVRSVLNLRRELMRAGHDVRVLTLEQRAGQAGELETEENQNVYFISSFSADKIYPQARVLKGYDFQVIHKIADWKPDIIHTQCEFSSFFLAERVVAKMGHVPVVHTYHTVYEDYTHYFFPNRKVGKVIVQRLTRLLMAKVDAVIAPTEKVTVMLEEYGVKCPIYTIPSGIDTGKYEIQMPEERRLEIRRQHRIPEDAVVLTYVGRMAKEKNVRELITFAGQLADRGLYLFLVGGGPMLEEIRKEAADSPAADYIRFAGMVSPDVVQEYYQTGDIFVSASVSETQGLTYIEALANGLPALCRKDECLDEVITEGENGFQYEDFDGFAAGLEQLLPLSPQERRQRARASVRKFSMEVFAAHVLKLYESLL